MKAEVVIAAQVPAGRTDHRGCGVPKSAVEALAGETAADVTVSTLVADVTLPNAAAGATGGSAG